jgi:hypothetical protein
LTVAGSHLPSPAAAFDTLCVKPISLRRSGERGMGPEGFEHPSLALSKTPLSDTPSAKSGAPNAENTPLDPDLARLIEAWPTLSADARAAILRLGGIL